MGKSGHSSLVIPTWDDHLTCDKCRLSARVCTLNINNPCSICRSWSTITLSKLWKSLRDARTKSVKRGTQHCSCNFPALLTCMDSASTSSDLISDTGSIADSDIKHLDLELAAVTAPAQVKEVSVHQGSVKAPPAIDVGQAPMMDNVIPAYMRHIDNLCPCTASGLYIQGWGDNSTHILNILPENFVVHVHRSVPIHGPQVSSHWVFYT